MIATLWQIEDDGAAAFAGRFYKSLSESSPSDALARTQREMIRDARYGAPPNLEELSPVDILG